MKLKKKKGLTLIEVIIAMAILGIVMATATVMFTANSNILSKVDAKSELQLEAQMIQEQLSTVALECSGIDSESIPNHLVLKDSNDTRLTHHFKLEGSQLSYCFSKDDPNGCFKLLEDDSELSEEEKAAIHYKELSNHVKTFSVQPQTTGMEYVIELYLPKGKNSEELSIMNNIVFRNK